MSPPTPPLVLDHREGTVSGPAGTIRLEPKVSEVLTVLARYSGHVVSRSDLMASVWPNVVVSDATLSRCIYQLREALRAAAVGGRDKSYEVIETLPRRGYRLLVEVDQAPTEMRISGEKLLIELRRRHVLVGGLIAFAFVLTVIVVSLIQ